MRDRETHDVDGSEWSDGSAYEFYSTCSSCSTHDSCSTRKPCDARESNSNRNSTHRHSRNISREPGFNRIHQFRLFVFVGELPISRGFPICQNSE